MGRARNSAYVNSMEGGMEGGVESQTDQTDSLPRVSQSVSQSPPFPSVLRSVRSILPVPGKKYLSKPQIIRRVRMRGESARRRPLKRDGWIGGQINESDR